MENKAVNIQLIGDGEGQVLVFINGQPHSGGYFCEYSLDERLERLLESKLVKYQAENKEELPF